MYSSLRDVVIRIWVNISVICRLVKWVILMSAVSSLLTALAIKSASTEERLMPLILSLLTLLLGILRAAKIAFSFSGLKRMGSVTSSNWEMA